MSHQTASELNEWFDENIRGEGGPLDPQRGCGLPDTIVDCEPKDLVGIEESVMIGVERAAEKYGMGKTEVIDTVTENRTHKDRFYERMDILEYFAHRTDCTNTEIADCLSVSPQTVSKYLDQYQIENHTHGVWDDTISWTKRAESVRGLDDNECAVCGRSSKEQREMFNCDLPVHHVVPKRFLETDEQKHAKENLVTLCSQCHRKYERMTPRELFLQQFE